EKAMDAGEFRSDLFYRFNTFTITLPRLSERTEDIPVLAYHFLRKAEAKVNKKVDRFSPEALDLLTRYPWPGNLRELENVIQRSVGLASPGGAGPPPLPRYLQEGSPIRIASEEGFLDAKERAIQHFEREA